MSIQSGSGNLEQVRNPTTIAEFNTLFITENPKAFTGPVDLGRDHCVAYELVRPETPEFRERFGYGRLRVFLTDIGILTTVAMGGDQNMTSEEQDHFSKMPVVDLVGSFMSRDSMAEYKGKPVKSEDEIRVQTTVDGQYFNYYIESSIENPIDRQNAQSAQEFKALVEGVNKALTTER
jgi:hypothetical protein